jgi:cytochrome c553
MIMGAKEAKTFKRITTAILSGTAVVTAAILIAGTMITFAPRQAQAKPEFAAQTGKPCGVCHANPSGGGKLKPEGEKFKQRGFK